MQARQLRLRFELERVLHLGDDRHRLLLATREQRRDRRRQRGEVRQARAGLVGKREVLAGTGPLGEERVVRVHEPERAVVHRAAGDEAVIRVEVALAKAHA